MRAKTAPSALLALSLLLAVAALVEEYLKMVEKTVRVRFEGWVRVRLPDMVECRQ